MSYDDSDPIAQAPPSATEQQLPLAVPEPAACIPDKRLDVIHDPDLDLLWEAKLEHHPHRR